MLCPWFLSCDLSVPGHAWGTYTVLGHSQEKCLTTCTFSLATSVDFKQLICLFFLGHICWLLWTFSWLFPEVLFLMASATICIHGMESRFSAHKACVELYYHSVPEFAPFLGKDEFWPRPVVFRLHSYS